MDRSGIYKIMSDDDLKNEENRIVSQLKTLKESLDQVYQEMEKREVESHINKS